MYPCSRSLGGNKIRLIKIYPGRWSDPISCELLYTSLDNINSYHTLSYVWGSRRITRPILMNGKNYEVTVNLESALRHLRHQLREGTLVWIDALCINQSDDDERTHQVGLMGSIYRNCKSVLVYIGDGVDRFQKKQQMRRGNSAPPPILKFGEDIGQSPIADPIPSPDTTEEHLGESEIGNMDKALRDTFRVFSLVETLSNAKHLKDLEWFQPTDNLTTQGEFRTLFESLRQFSHAPFTPWWTRIWVVQEAVLPPVVTVICGTVSAPWTMFARAASKYFYHSRHCCYLVSTKVPRDYLNVLQSFCRLILDLNELRETFSDTSTHGQLQLVSRDTSLLSLLRRFRNRKASDPRDKVYALLSLSLSTSVRPDYSMSEREVFIRAALDSIYTSESLSVLHVDISRKYRQDLPSWVPDWEAQGDFNDNHRLDTLNLYQIYGRPIVSGSAISSCGDCLLLDYKFVDTIEKVDSVMLSDDVESMCSTIHQWCSTARKARNRVSSASTEGFWRIFCADIITTPPRSNGKGSVRRARRKDEFMFAKWTLLSPSSPFNFSRYKDKPSPWFENFFSNEGRIWWVMSSLELYIAENDFFHAIEELREVFRDRVIMGLLVRNAINKAFFLDGRALLDQSGRPPDLQETGHKPLDLDEIVKFAILTPREFLALEEEGYQERLRLRPESRANKAAVRREVRHLLRQDQQRAWNQVPWPMVLEEAWLHLKHQYGAAIPHISINVPEKVAIIENSILSATKYRRLFVTSKGNLGLGPASMRRGDHLCILQGGRTPFILRKGDGLGLHINSLPRDAAARRQESSDDITLKGYELVGDCYAHGVMNSEPKDGPDSRTGISTVSTEPTWETIAIR